MLTCENSVRVISAVTVPNGFFLQTEERKKDFWLFLGPAIGWGLFRRASKRIVDANKAVFEMVEIRHPDSAPPDDVKFFANVLWRRKEALEVEKSFQSIKKDFMH